MVYPHLYRSDHSETETSNGEYGKFFAHIMRTEIKITDELHNVIRYIMSNYISHFQKLQQLIECKTVSGQPKCLKETVKAIQIVEGLMDALHIKYNLFDVNIKKVNGKKVSAPPLLLASLGKNPTKKTICVYVYLDVPEPDLSKWKYDPWTITYEDKNIYGNGVATGKGVLILWLLTIEAFQKCNMELPVNLKFIIESMHFCESAGLQDIIDKNKQDFFYNIDYIAVSDYEWLGTKIPCLVYGAVGRIKLDIIIEKEKDSDTDINDDMNLICGMLGDNEENILIPKFNDTAKQITPEAEKLYETIRDLDLASYAVNLPPFKKKWNQVKLLMHSWRVPTIKFKPIEKCTCNKEGQEIIRRKIVFKIVANQAVEESLSLIKNYIEKIVKEKNIKNKVRYEVLLAKRYWNEDYSNDNFLAAKRALIQITKEVPNVIRLEKPEPTLTLLDRTLEKSIVVIPFAAKGSNLGQANENIGNKNYYEGCKILAAYMYQISFLK